ncbi:MAG: hypothetical protein WAO83_21715 [Fuerstiella sp.]
MGSKRPGLMKSTTKAAGGGVIVVAALLALMLFRGPGLGTNDGDAEKSQPMASTEAPNVATSVTAPANANRENTDSNTTPKLDTGGLTPDEQKALSGNVLSILIDERDFLMELPGADVPVFRPAKLSRLVELAALAKGDSNGIRVRVNRRENARASAENQIKLELSKIGIGEGGIYMPAEFIP